MDRLGSQSCSPSRVLVIDSSSDDNTCDRAREAGYDVHVIARDEFDHGGTRQLGVELCDDADIIVFMTQDAMLEGDCALERLLTTFHDRTVAAAYGRQLPSPEATEVAAHARHYNYPGQSLGKTIAIRDQLGLKTAFCSNSFAAYNRASLLEVGGFPERSLFGEDMHAAARLLLAGKTIQYAADATVLHSHNYSYRDEFRRCFDIGAFHAMNPWLLDEFGGAEGEGLRFIRSELRYVGIGGAADVFIRTVAKYGGYVLGRRYRWFPSAICRAMSSFRHYWK